MPDTLPILPMIVATAIGCVVLAILLAFPWIADWVADAMQAEAAAGEGGREREATANTNTNTNAVPAEAVEPLAELELGGRDAAADRC